MSKQDLKLQKALDANIDELYAIIGLNSSGKMYGSTPSMEELIENGKKWFHQKKKNFKLLVCKNDTVKVIANNDATFELALLIKDILIKEKLSIDIDSIVAIIIKNGIKNYCYDLWE